MGGIALLMVMVRRRQKQKSQRQALGISVNFSDNQYRVLQSYTPQLTDELELQTNDVIYMLKEYDDGWAKGFNTRTEKTGVFPVSVGATGG